MIAKLHYISQGNTPKEHIENIQKACTSGIEMVQLNVKNVTDEQLEAIAKEAREITSFYQTRLIIVDDYKIAKTVKADGLHITTKNVNTTKARLHLYTWQIIGATANTLQDCQHLIKEQVDYIYLSPFKNTASKNTTEPVLGLNGFTLLTEALQTTTPIIGFGEITMDDVTAIIATGINGIAISEAITANFDSIKTFNQLLKASSTDEKRHQF